MVSWLLRFSLVTKSYQPEATASKCAKQSVRYRLLKKVRNERHDWLTEQQPANLEKIRKFQDTGVENIDNRIALLQDPASHQHWIRHLVDEGEAFWFEYQPITSDEASALQADQDLFRRYVLHQWVD